MDGVCPECGRPVRRSIIPVGLRFESFRALRRTRLGIGLWVLALALPPICTSAYTIVMLVTPLIWGEMAPPMQPFRLLWLATVYAWSFAGSAGICFTGAAVFLITFPFARHSALFRPRLAIFAAGAALLSTIIVIVHVYYYIRGLPALPAPSLLSTTATIVVICTHTVALLLCWIYLMLRLDREHFRRLRPAMWAGLLAIGLFALELPVQIFLSLEYLWATPFGGGGALGFDPPAWWWSVSSFHEAWSKYGATTCYIVMILCLWAYIRTLDAALRMSRG